PPAVLAKSLDGPPGTAIEREFKPLHMAVEGDGSRRAIDDLISTLNQVANNLQLLANPLEVPRANAALQALLATLQNSAPRLPRPFSDMIRGAIGEFEGDVAQSTAGQVLVALRDQVLPECKRIITGRYPFTRGSDQDVPLVDFGRVFGGGGLLDGFFKQHLQQYADTSRPTW